MGPKISVIICTHNPRPDYLARTLEGLKNQTLSYDQWELLLIDNASDSPLAGLFPIDWHPAGQQLQERQVGKTKAVLLGISKAQAELIIFVDDDNVLSPDYLEQALDIAREWPKLGTWGGSTFPEYEIPPPAWLKPYECYLSIREITKTYWFNLTAPSYYGMLPYGAGLCIRKSVANDYLQQLNADPVRKELDRKGTSLISAGDTDMALVGCDLGLGTGLFTQLKLIHLIHKGRLTEQYMEKMLREMTASCLVLAAKRGIPVTQTPLVTEIWQRFSARRRGARESRFYRAAVQGTHEASRIVESWPKA